MENLVEKVNERFLEMILRSTNPTELDILTSAYRNFVCSSQIMQDIGLTLDDLPCCDECCQF